MAEKYRKTIISCYLGYIIQASVNNLTPLLFVRFGFEFGVTAEKLAFLIIANFGIQILVDANSASAVLKFGYKKCSYCSYSLCILGLVGLGTLPYITPPFIGILVSTALTAIGGGFLEVVVSPIIEALPLKNKSGAMSFLHSFYSWGHISVIAISTVYFNVFGINNWRYLPFIWAILPLINIFLFIKAPVVNPEGDARPVTVKKLFRFKSFPLFFVMILAAGAAEQAIAQWASYFAEIGLSIENKTMGDLAGGCLFAFGMALTRTVYGFIGDKVDLKKVMAVSAILLTAAFLTASLAPVPIISLAAVAASGLFVGIMWPGIYSLAGKNFPEGGTKMFGLLALGGDIGCTLGPFLVGIVSSDIKIGLLAATAFPILLVICLTAFGLKSKNFQ